MGLCAVLADTNQNFNDFVTSQSCPSDLTVQENSWDFGVVWIHQVVTSEAGEMTRIINTIYDPKRRKWSIHEQNNQICTEWYDNKSDAQQEFITRTQIFFQHRSQ